MIPYYETPSTTPSNLSSGTVDKYVRLRMEYYLASPLFDCCLIPQVNLSLANQLDLFLRCIRCNLPWILFGSRRKFWWISKRNRDETRLYKSSDNHSYHFRCSKKVHGANITKKIFAKDPPYLSVNFYASPSERKERGEFSGKEWRW